MRYAEIETALNCSGLAGEMERVETLATAVVSDGVEPLVTPALRVLRGGGKRLRSALVLAAADAAGGDMRAIESHRAATAVELVHLGSLVHDDILDEATTRRGTPTINSCEGPERALLVGDYILAKAGRIAASVSQEVALDIALVIEDLARGQVLEEESIGDVKRSLDDAYASIDGKTASLFATACLVGARCATEDADVLGAYARFGNDFGRAFQLIDDLADLLGDPTRTGKMLGTDVAGGVYTVPLILALKYDFDGSFARDLVAARSDVGALERVIESFADSEAVGRTLAQARSLCASATAHLSGSASSLVSLPEWYLGWAVASQLVNVKARRDITA